MNCPSCKTVELKMTDRNGVEIDYCPNCRGIWLDRGELDKIIERSAAYQPNPTKSHYDDDDRYKGEYKPKKKRGSFLEELFDF